jgi:hypothetical protein
MYWFSSRYDPSLALKVRDVIGGVPQLEGNGLSK